VPEYFNEMMMQGKILCVEINKMDLVNYLEKLGHTPQKIRNNDYWYLSPLRDEKTASFKVNRKMNVWYDHATGKGGTLVDFGLLYYNCSVKDFLEKITDEKGMIVSFHPQHFSLAGEKKQLQEQSGKINILSSDEITDSGLLKYLQERQIPVAIASQFCQQVCFELYNKKHLAIGFQNNSGGYELRNRYFKGSSTPKQPKLIVQNDAKELSVFEGFFSFLSFQTLLQSNQKNNIELPARQTDFLILNSLSFFEKSRETMEKYSQINLFLDRDLMGLKCTKDALKWSDKYKDHSKYYRRFKDLNEHLIKSVHFGIKQSRSKGMRL
jgi:CHC2 zinc finger/Toprim-like